jgi:hypothetical protein
MNLKEIMSSPLPPKTDQYRRKYRPEYKDIFHMFELLNQTIFNSELSTPSIQLRTRCRGYWGMCFGNQNCQITLSDKWFCPQWTLMILAHELCHQYQYEILGPTKGKKDFMNHGPTFFSFKERMLVHNIPLKISYCAKKWFEHQNFFKV